MGPTKSQTKVHYFRPQWNGGGGREEKVFPSAASNQQSPCFSPPHLVSEREIFGDETRLERQLELGLTGFVRFDFSLNRTESKSKSFFKGCHYPG